MKQEVGVLTRTLGGGGGLQRRFLSGAGAAKFPDGLFFSTSTTAPDSALSLDTRCLSCQPTCGTNHTVEQPSDRPLEASASGKPHLQIKIF